MLYEEVLRSSEGRCILFDFSFCGKRKCVGDRSFQWWWSFFRSGVQYFIYLDVTQRLPGTRYVKFTFSSLDYYFLIQKKTKPLEHIEQMSVTNCDGPHILSQQKKPLPGSVRFKILIL